MKHSVKRSMNGWVLASAVFSLAFLPQMAHAALTLAGTDVQNTASLAYSVNLAPQTPVSGSVTFKVDRKVILTVQNDGTVPVVVPGQSNVPLKFTITNESNADLDFVLTPDNVIDGVTVPGGTDIHSANNDIAAFTLYADTNGNGTYDPGTDLAIPGNRLTGVERLDGPTANGNVRTVFVVSNIKAAPNTVNNDVIGVALTATAYELSSGPVVAESTGVDVTTTVETVLADAASVAGDTARNGAYAAYGGYKVETVELVLTKTVLTVWDPLNGDGSGSGAFPPKAIPGAIVEYCMVITNPGNATGTNLVVTDPIPSNTDYYATSLGGTAPTAGVFTGLGDDAACRAKTGQHVTSYGSYDVPNNRVVADFNQLLPTALNILPSMTGGSPTPGYSPIWIRFYVVVQN